MRYKEHRHQDYEWQDVLDVRLLDAIRANDLGLMQSIVNSEKCDLADLRLGCNDLLHSAIIQGHLNIADWLLEQGYPVNAGGDDLSASWSTALHVAIQHKFNHMVIKLLAKAAYTFTKNSAGQSPLHVACDVGNVEALELLLRRDKSVLDMPDNSLHTPLHATVERNCLEAVQLLLDHGANVNARTAKADFEGFAPLHLAVVRQNLDVARALLLYGADVDATVSLARERAAQRKFGHHGIVYNGFTPLHLAVKVQAVETMIILLLDHHANVDAAVQETGITPLHLAVQMKNKKILLTFSKYHPNFLARTLNGKNVLHLAIENNWRELAEMLLIKNADPNDQTIDGDAPLHLAVRLGSLDMVKFLLNNSSVNINLKNFQGETPLHIAVQFNSDITKLLLKKDALVDEINNKNQTSLALAVKNHDIDTIPLILNHKPSIYNAANRAALIYACKKLKDFNEVFNSLTEYCLQLLENIMNSKESLKKLPFNYVALFDTVLSSIFLKNPKFRLNTKFNLINDMKMVKLLMKYRCSFDLKNEKSDELLDSAIESTDFEMVQLLLSNGISVHRDNIWTALKVGNLHMIKVFFEQDINLNIFDEYGTTVLHFAVWHEHIELINCLIIEKKVCVNTMNNIKDQMLALSNINKIATSPLHIAVIKKNQKIVSMLLDNGADVNCKNGKEATPLHYATKNASDLKIIKKLLRYGANINVVDSRNKLPAHYIFHQTCICNEEFRLYYDLTNDCKCDIAEDFEERVADEVVEIYVKHIVYLISMNETIDSNNIDVLANSKNFDKIQILCIAEITKMKKENFFEHITYYDVLVKKYNALAAYGRNKELIQVFEKSGYQDKFPIYAEILTEQFDEAQCRAPLLESAGIAFNKLVSLDVPQVILYIIFDNLITKDLDNLSLAYP